MNLVAYTDASHCSKERIASSGFMVYNRSVLIKNTVYFLGNMLSVAIAESYAVEQALQYCFLVKGVESITIYTDQINAPSKKYREKINRWRESQAIIEIIEEHGIKVEIKWVKAHNGNKLHNKVDRNCSNELRKYIRDVQKNKTTKVWSSRYSKGRLKIGKW